MAARLTLTRGTLAIFVLLLCVQVQAAQRDPATLFHDYCSVCHGDAGDGRSRAQGSMVPPPRDFTTPAAAMELDRERMIDAVLNGRPGTAMAAWSNQLSRQEAEAVVDYIRNVLMRPIASETAEESRRLYAENCSVCHGDDGRGAKWTLRNMSPPPRNFTLKESREALDRNRMIRSVTHGKANTAMPGFDTQLNAEQIALVVDYVRSAFMRIGPDDTANDAGIETTARRETRYPDGLVGNLDSGKAFYLANCSTCHGIEGDGKGPRAYFILPKPRDFRHPGARNTLDRARLFEAIAKGTRGAEMPAWDKVLTPQQIADIAEYVYQAYILPGDDGVSAVTR